MLKHERALIQEWMGTCFFLEDLKPLKSLKSWKISFYTNMLIHSHILIFSTSRYAIINPKNYDNDRHSKLFALVGGFDEELWVPIDGGVLLGDKQVFVLDSTLTLDYLLLRENPKPLNLPTDVCSGHINIEDISSDFDDVQEFRIEDDRAPTNQNTPDFSSTNSINKEQANKLK